MSLGPKLLRMPGRTVVIVAKDSGLIAGFVLGRQED